MGEPADPTKDELVAAHHLASAIVSAVAQDLQSPLDVLIDASDPECPKFDVDDETVRAIDHRLLVLAQLVIRQDREIELLRSVWSAAEELARNFNDTSGSRVRIDAIEEGVAKVTASVDESRAEIEELRRG